MGRIIMRYFIASCLAAMTLAAKQVQWDDAYFKQLAESWVDTQLRPFIEANRPTVEENIKIRLEETYGPILPVCAKGEACRAGKLEAYYEALQNEWAVMLAGFEADLEAQIIKSRNSAEDVYFELVECHTNDWCCPVSESQQRSLYE